MKDVLAVIVAVFISIVAMQPSEFRIARTATTSAPAAVVFAQVNDFHKWEAWSPYEKLDPAMKRTYEGALAGTGAIYMWAGNHDVGEGRTTIIESRPNELIQIKKETSMTFESQHVSVSINRSADQVYAFASNPENLPQWAAGLGGSIKNVNGDWIAASPMGSVKVKFADQNVFGVLDHDVTLPSGEKVYNPVRVFPNNDGSELIFTLYRRPGTSNQLFAEDAQAVTRDLKKLKALLEK